MWKTVTGLGKLQRRYLDPVSGQAGYFGIVEEGSTSAIVTVRVKVEDRKITEAEWLIARQGRSGPERPGAAGSAGWQLLRPGQPLFEPASRAAVPRNDRSSREAMVAVTNSYFDGITTHDGAIIMAHPGCTRVENGATVTGRAGGPGARGGAAAPARGGSAAVTDCTSNLETINVQLVAARRYPIVDEEAGVVLGLGGVRPQAGDDHAAERAQRVVRDRQRKIRSIYSAMFYPSSEVPVPNWPPYDGNWPIRSAVP